LAAACGHGLVQGLKPFRQNGSKRLSTQPR
jgi:hypothetical protein